MPFGIATTAKGSSFKSVEYTVKEPAADEILVEPQYSGLNAIDRGQALTAAYVNEFPYFLGKEFVGQVLQTGSGITDLKKGDKVFGVGYGQAQAGWKQQLTIRRAHVVKLSAKDDDKGFGGVAHCFYTAYATLFSGNGLRLTYPPTKEDTETPVIIWSASTSVGFFAIQILQYLGFQHILAVASQKHFDSLRKLGAHHVFDRSDADVVDQLTAATQKKAAIALVYQADEQGWATLVKVLQKGDRVRFIVRAAPTDEQTQGLDVKRVVAFDMLPEEHGDKAMSKVAQEMLDQGKLQYKPYKLVESQADFVQTLEHGYRQVADAGATKLIVAVH